MSNLKLYRHQQVALGYLRLNSSWALFMEQGTGKTIPTLVRILELVKTNKIETCLIIGPNSALGAWSRDIELFTPEEQTLLKSIITTVSYDKVWRGGKSSPYFKTWDCIVLDEAHYIKNRTSKRSDFILKIACNAKYRYILTGTPISNGQLENIWALYTFLYPELYRGRARSQIFGSYRDFENRYCILNQYYKPAKYVHVNELQDIIAEHCYRVKKIDCLDLPDKLPDEIVEIEIAEKAIYKKMMKDSAILEYEILAENPLTRRLKMRQICSGFIQNEDELIELKCNKLAALTEIIESFEDNKKLVIFAQFKHSIKSIGELLKRLKIKYITLDGDQKNKLIWRDFQSDNNIRVIVCQYQTANAGIDLFASDTILFFEPTDRSQILEQCRDRTHRNGQKNKCSYIHLLTKGTIEIAMYKALSGFSDFNENLFTEYMNTYQKSWIK